MWNQLNFTTFTFRKAWTFRKIYPLKEIAFKLNIEWILSICNLHLLGFLHVGKKVCGYLRVGKKYLHVGKKLFGYLHVSKTGKGKRRGKAGGNKIQQEAHVPVIFYSHCLIAIAIVIVMALSFYIYIFSLPSHHYRTIAIAIAIVINIVMVITLREGMGLQAVEGGEGEGFLDRELPGRELRQPFWSKRLRLIMMVC